jgi:hypothetical protein
MSEETNNSETINTTIPRRVESETVRFSLAWADFFGGVAQSAATAFRAFRDELTVDNITDVSASNGYLKGLAAGNAQFFDGLAKTSDQVYADLATERHTAQDLSTSLDYERLAKLVAAEMKKQQK